MGDSLPPPASFDLVGSFARRRGADVEIVLARPEAKIGDAATVVLRREGVSVRASAQLGDDPRYGTRLTVRAPRAELANGRWTLTLQSDGVDQGRLAARLLVQGERPLVLLWGAGNTFSASAPRRRKDSAQRRAAATVGKAVDRALETLPEDLAVQVRTRARNTARKLLP